MNEPLDIKINQSCAILIDGNNIEMSLQSLVGKKNALVDFDVLIPKLLVSRGLSRLIYFREGKSISAKLADRLLNHFHGSVMPCHKSADIPLTIKATQIANKVDTIIILSGDSDYVELVRHLRGEGVRVEIAAVKQTTAQILIDEADHFTAITEEHCYILKPARKPSSRSTPEKNTSTTNSRSSSSKPESKSPPSADRAKKTSESPSPQKKSTRSSRKGRSKTKQA